jgi:hypothetical protein
MNSPHSGSSWEGWGPTWAEPEAGARADSDDELLEADYNNIEATDAGEELAAMIVQLKLQSTLSAKQAVVLAFWAARAGATGLVNQLGTKPGQASGAYSRHFDKIVGNGPDDLDYYYVGMGRRMRHEASRRWDNVPTIPPHESLGDEFSESSRVADLLTEAKSAGTLPGVYGEHDFVKQAPPDQPPQPFCLYLDGVSYSRLDTILGVFVYFMLSGKRHLVANVRKSEYCGCGCRGWCTLQPIFSMLSWSLAAMRTGIHPDRRHDGKEWGDGDGVRKVLAGSPMGFRGVCLFVKGDWMEYINSLGLPSYKNTISPCPFCHTDVDLMYTVAGFSPLGMPSRPKTLWHYEAACRACERYVLIATVALQNKIKMVLDYDKRAAGSKGRALTVDIPELALCKGDRLEPGPSMLDVAGFEDHVVPFTCVFWRVSSQTMAKHRNPLFSTETGVSPASLGIDWLHALSLGVFQHYLAHLVWDLVLANAWSMAGPMVHRMELSVVSLRAELWIWYGEEAKQGRHWTRVQGISTKMMGTAEDKQCKLHGSETNGVLVFADSLLERCQHLLGDRGHNHRRSLDALLAIYHAIKDSHGGNLSPDAIGMFCDNVLVHLQANRALDVPSKPKHHMLLEMGARLIGSSATST